MRVIMYSRKMKLEGFIQWLSSTDGGVYLVNGETLVPADAAPAV